MRTTLCLFLFGILIVATSCRSDFDFEPSAGNLAFSRDTVYLDTVFTNIGSSTYTLKVYNKSDKNISIPNVRLGKGNTSKYRMTVDGMTGLDEDGNGVGDGKIFSNVELLAKDSLFIFIETTADVADANPDDFLYTDQILFGTATNQQKVELVTLIQDAYFIFPKRINGVYDTVDFGFDEDENITQVRGRNLEHNHPDNNDEYTWGNDKPYVIYGFAAVPADETLNINPGARVHFHADSGIIVQEGGTLKINGQASNTDALENEVIFEGDRLEPLFSDIPGQWGFIYLRQGSKNHTVNHLTLKNSTVGFLIENNFENPMTITNTQIYNSSNVGILARFARINGFNVVINSAGIASIGCTFGGSYNFTHCTFNNNWPSSSQFAVVIDNFYNDANDQPVAFDLTEANFTNCIIYGSNQVELLLNKNDTKLFQYNFDHCLVKFNDNGTSLATNPLYDLIRNEENGNIKNQNPNFFDIQNNNLNIDETSAATGNGNLSFSQGTFDLDGFPRMGSSDIGAYNFKIVDED